jgi:hypothetical protein
MLAPAAPIAVWSRVAIAWTVSTALEAAEDARRIAAELQATFGYVATGDANQLERSKICWAPRVRCRPCVHRMAGPI